MKNINLPCFNEGVVNNDINFKFVTEVITWEHSELPASLVMCQYQLANFSPFLFEEYNICLPVQIMRSVEKRQAEFLAGRVVAKKAIEQGLGNEFCLDVEISNNRSPKWPEGVCGSIAHTGDTAIAITVSAETIDVVGIDIEDYFSPRVAAEVSTQIHDQKELELVRKLGVSDEYAITLIFSAKESLFKALHKHVNEYFGFECAFVSYIEQTESRLQLTLERRFREKHQLKASYDCYFAFSDSHLVTFILNSL